MAKSDQLVVNFAIYEDGTEYLGMGEVEFPEIAFLTEEIKGAGLAGNLEAVVIGHLESMTTTFNFNTVSDAAVKLTEPRIHNIDCRVSQQIHDTRTGKTTQEAVKHIMRTMPKKFAPGKGAVASAAEASGEHACYYYAVYKNGVRKIELDPMNFICFINGVDYLKEVRKALGK